MKKLGTLSVVVTLMLLALSTTANADPLSEAWASVERASQATLPSSFTWRFRSFVFHQPKSREVLDRVRADFVNQGVHQGLSKDASATYAEKLTARVADARTELRWGTKTCTVNGDVVKATCYTESLQRGDAPTKPINKTITEYVSPRYRTRFFDPHDRLPGEVDFIRPNENSFGYTGGMELDPYVLGLRPLTLLFDAKNVVSSGRSITLARAIKEDAGIDHEDTVTWDDEKQIPLTLKLAAGPQRRIAVEYLVTATRKIAGHTVPSRVTYRVLHGNGKESARTEYELVSATFGTSVVSPDITAMGRLDVQVVDYRLGRGNERQYKYGRQLLSEQELAAMGRPLPRTIVHHDGNPYLLPLGAMAGIFLVIGLWQIKTTKRQGA